MKTTHKFSQIFFCVFMLICKEGLADIVGLNNANTNTNSNTSSSVAGADATSNGNVANNTNAGSNITTITSNNSGHTVFPAGSKLIPLAPQNIFNDPGTGANITGIPLIWYYVDAFGMMNCEGLSEPIVENTSFVSISFQPDCATVSRPIDVNLVNDRPIVTYSSDLQQNLYYSPLGVIMAQANWDKSDQVNLFTIMKSASNFVAKHIKGYDTIILVSDILQRNISSQRSIEGMSQGITMTPSISSTLGSDGISGAMFGYGRSNGESHPVSRTGVTLLVVAVAPGPWVGRKPQFTQTAYVTNATALPQNIQKKATEDSGNSSVNLVKGEDKNKVANKYTLEEAAIVSGSGRH